MKISTKILTSAFSIGVLLSSCNSVDCVSGSGNQISDDRNVGSFTRIETSGSIKVILRQGNVNSVKVTADDNIIKDIETYTRGNRLMIDLDLDFCDASPITVYVTSPSYERVEASGAVELLSDGKLNVTDFELDLSGSSRVVLDMNAANVKTTSSGESEISLTGQAGSHELELSGSTSVNALDFVVSRYKIESTGSSDTHINVLNELHISSSGSSDIEYRGNPSKITNDESGASSLKKIN